MKYLLYISIVLVIVLSYFGVFAKSEQRLSNEQQTKQSVDEVQPKQNEVEQKRWKAKTDEQPPVTVTITPVELSKDTQLWKFQVILDTHSGSLDDDLLEIASLTGDGGSAYYPISWEGPGPGGHHREGVLVFNAIDPVPTYIELKIKGVGGIPERLFKWNTR